MDQLDPHGVSPGAPGCLCEGWCEVLRSGTYLSVNVDMASEIITAYPEAQRTAHAPHGSHGRKLGD